MVIEEAGSTVCVLSYAKILFQIRSATSGEILSPWLRDIVDYGIYINRAVVPANNICNM